MAEKYGWASEFIEDAAARDVLGVLLDACAAADDALRIKSDLEVDTKRLADAVLNVIVGLYARLPFNPFWQQNGQVLLGGMSASIMSRLDAYSLTDDYSPQGATAFLSQYYQPAGVACQIAALAGVKPASMRAFREAVLKELKRGDNA